MNELDRKTLSEFLNQIALENSGSESTFMHYRDAMKQFCEVTKVSLSEIANEWNNIDTYRKEKVFKKRVKRLIKLFEVYLEKKDYAKGSKGAKLTAIYSFFNKYLEVGVRAILPPDVITYHNTPIEKEQVKQILGQSNLRNSLVYYLMIQGGLRPYTIAKLKYKDIKEDYEANTIPLRIVVRKEIAKGKYGNYYTFVGEETVNLLHRVLKQREINNTLNDESYIVKAKDTMLLTREYTNSKSFSIAFRRTVEKLKLQPHEVKKGKPKPLRLYNLRKYFRNRASSGGLDYMHFWMGHKLKHDDEHYFDKDTVEVHRERYKKFVLPQVRIFETQIIYKKQITKGDLVKFFETEEGKQAISEIIEEEIRRAFQNPKTTELPNATKTEIELFP